MTPPRRNVEIKARDADPATTLERALALGASDEGIVAQRDTYFGGARGRLKLREQEPGGAQLIAYARPDGEEARTSDYRLAEVGDPAALREALDAALGTRVVVDKRRHLLLWEGVRIHLDTVRGLGTFLELEGVAAPGSDLSAERARVAQLSEALGLDESRILADSYSDRLLGADALVAAGRRRATEAAVIADGGRPCVPCGGCRQRLRELMPLDDFVHLCSAAGERRSVTLGELLPMSFGPEFLP